MIEKTVWRVATRRSSLAQRQARTVADLLASATGVPAELVPLSTTGDEYPDRAVEAFDSKGLFVDGVRQAVLEGRADCVVHSYKDLPTEPAAGLTVAAVPGREDPRDALVTREGAGLATLPRGATVGTSSARRRAQLQRARRDLILQPLRGNLDTRLRRVAGGELDAVVVALAGLVRLGPVDLPLRVVPLEHGECLHAPAQGALAVECRRDDAVTRDALARIDDSPTRLLVAAERALLTELQGGCTAPIGAHAQLLAGAGSGPRTGAAPGEGALLEVLGMVADPTGTHLLRGSHQGPADDAGEVGRELANRLLARGGRDILERVRRRDQPVPMGGP